MTTPDTRTHASRKQTVVNLAFALTTIIGAPVVALLIIAFVILAVTFRG